MIEGIFTKSFKKEKKEKKRQKCFNCNVLIPVNLNLPLASL